MLFWICAILVIALCIYIDAKAFDGENWGGVLFAMLLMSLALFGGLRAKYVRNHNLDQKEYMDLKVESLGKKEYSEFNGTFILGSGSINGGVNSYYITYGIFSSGSKRLELSTNRYYLRETNSESPRIKKYFYQEKRLAFKSLWWGNRKYSEDGWYYNYDANILVIPKNTIYKKFDQVKH